jgi:lambda family phage portal protein
MLPLKMLGGYFEAELIGARIGASAMGFFQRTKESYGTDITASLPEGENTLAMDADPGAFSFLPAGYEIAKWSAEHPNSQFPAFIKAQMRLVALGLGVSYTTLASDLEGVNYSSIRAGILEERDEWRALQEWWIGAFYEPIFAEFLNAALLTGALKLDSRDFRKFLECKWTPRGFQWVDPLKEVQAGILAISIGLASRSGIAAERGDEFEEIVEETADDLAIAALYGVDVTGPPNVKKPTDATDVSNETADTPAGTSTASDDERALTDAEMQVWLRRANAPRIARALQRAGWSKPSTNGHH